MLTILSNNEEKIHEWVSLDMSFFIHCIFLIWSLISSNNVETGKCPGGSQFWRHAPLKHLNGIYHSPYITPYCECPGDLRQEFLHQFHHECSWDIIRTSFINLSYLMALVLVVKVSNKKFTAPLSTLANFPVSSSLSLGLSATI